MRAILLAAGRGLRLSAATGGQAKALADLNGRPLVHHALDNLREAGFPTSRTVVVTGCDAEAVTHVARRVAPSATIVHNPHFREQNLLSLLSARPLLDEGFLLANVDHVMAPAIYGRLRDAGPTLAAATDRGRPLTDDDMKVRVSDGRIRAASKSLAHFTHGYIGLTRVARDAVPAYLRAADQVLHARGPAAAVVEDVLAHLGPTPDAAAPIDCSDLPWLEIDTPADLRRARSEPLP